MDTNLESLLKLIDINNLEQFKELLEEKFNATFATKEEAYTKPTNGIPKTDLASSVQSSLGKADTALQPDDIVDNLSSLAHDKVPSAYAVNELLVNYIDASVSNAIDYVDQQDQNEHSGRVAGDNLLAKDVASAKLTNSLKKLAPLFHQITCDELDYDYAREYFQSEFPDTIGGCSAVRVGDYFGRNLDWFAPLEDIDASQPDFYVSTPKTDKYKAVKGIASLAGITELMAKEHQTSDLWKVLPFFLQDGFNGSLFACINVVPTDKGPNTETIPTVSKEDTICSRMLVRYVLDRFDNALEACTYLQEHVAVYMQKSLKDMHYESHFMIGDKDHTYVLEFVDNAIVFNEHDKMTNFFIDGVNFLDNGKVYTNADAGEDNLPTSLGITSYGAGLERYNILVEGASDVRTLMNKLLYSKAYDLTESPYWYSEFTDSELEITVDTLPTDTKMQEAIEYAQEIKRGEREGRLWKTTHSVVYNLKDGSLDVVSFEDTENPLLLNPQTNAVLYVPQALTDEEKQQARDNIDGISGEETKGLINDNLASDGDIDNLFV